MTPLNFYIVTAVGFEPTPFRTGAKLILLDSLLQVIERCLLLMTLLRLHLRKIPLREGCEEKGGGGQLTEY